MSQPNMRMVTCRKCGHRNWKHICDINPPPAPKGYETVRIWATCDKCDRLLLEDYMFEKFDSEARERNEWFRKTMEGQRVEKERQEAFEKTIWSKLMIGAGLTWTFFLFFLILYTTYWGSFAPVDQPFLHDIKRFCSWLMNLF